MARMKKTLQAPVCTLALALALGTLSFGAAAPALAQVSVGIGIGVDLPGVRIGVNVPMFPNLVRVPNSPAYYAPQLAANYFFYDDRYWVYTEDRWYTSTWYDGPWGYVQPEVVPLYVLRIPVRYYRLPPSHFRGWQRDTAPHWGEHWGPAWQNQRRGWDQWDRRRVPAPVALPVYQRDYRGDRYPASQQQQQMYQQREWQRRDGRGDDPRRGAAPQRTPAYEQPRALPPRARPDLPERQRLPERSEPQRGNDRADHRGNERDNGRGNERGNERKPDRDRKG